MHVHTWNEAGKQCLCLHCWALTSSICAWTWSFLAEAPCLCLLYLFSFSLSLYFLPLLLPFSMDCQPAGGLKEDGFLWGTKVILLRRYASLSKADTLLKNYSPHWAPRQPVERLWKGLKGMGDTGRLLLSTHRCAVMWEAGVKSFIRSGRRCL